jgi:hypothetical protein
VARSRNGGQAQTGPRKAKLLNLLGYLSVPAQKRRLRTENRAQL